MVKFKSKKPLFTKQHGEFHGGMPDDVAIGIAMFTNGGQGNVPEA